MDPYELRRLDLRLSDDDRALRKTFSALLAKECDSAKVRAAEPVGFDAHLWQKFCWMGATSMSLPEEAGGDGAGLLQMTLVADEIGRALAPLPLIEHVVASRLLARVDPTHRLLASAVSGETILGISLEPLIERRLVSVGAVCAEIIGVRDDNLVALSSCGPRTHVRNQGGLPYAWCDPATEAVEVISFSREDVRVAVEFARREWKILSAGALAGLAEAALELGVSFVKSRETLGVPIGTLQGVSFPLTEIRIGITGARNLAWQAAWMLDHEPTTNVYLAAAAHAYASRVATHGVTTAAHSQGGLGFTDEADASLYFLRAKGWSLAAGPPQDDARDVGRAVLDSAEK